VSAICSTSSGGPGAGRGLAAGLAGAGAGRAAPDLLAVGRPAGGLLAGAGPARSAVAGQVEAGLAQPDNQTSPVNAAATQTLLDTRTAEG
jgi:hypothetical protein